MKILFALVGVLALTACSMTTTSQYDKPRTAEMLKFKDLCAYEISLTQLNKAEHGDKFKACMEKHSQQP